MSFNLPIEGNRELLREGIAQLWKDIEPRDSTEIRKLQKTKEGKKAQKNMRPQQGDAPQKSSSLRQPKLSYNASPSD